VNGRAPASKALASSRRTTVRLEQTLKARPAGQEPGWDRLGGYRSLFSNTAYVRLLGGGALSFSAPTGALIVLAVSIGTAFGTGANDLRIAALAIALLGLSAAVPTLATMFVSGTLADRLERRRLMRWTNAIAAAAVAAMIAVFLLRPSASIVLPGGTAFPLWVFLLYPLWAAVTVCVTIFRPTLNASLPRVIAPTDLGRGNGLMTTTSLVLLVGVSLGAPALYDLSGPAIALVLPLLCLLVGQSYLQRLQQDLSGNRATAPRRSFFTDSQAGFRYIFRHRTLLEITLTALGINFLTALAFVMLPIYVTSWLALAPSAAAFFLGVLYAAGSLGAATGGLLVNRFAFEGHAGAFLATFTLLQGLSVLALALFRSPWLVVPDIFLFGMFPGMYGVVFVAGVQATVPNELLGRVFAADEVGSYSMYPVGQYAGGVTTFAFGVQTTYLIGGAGTAAIGLLMWALKDLRAFRYHPSRPEPPPELVPTPLAPPVPATETVGER
jgi:hypothetical protein